MNEADRAEVALVWNAMCLANPRIGRSILDGEMVEMLAAAKRKWENAKLEEAAEAIHYWDTALGDASSAIERLKQE